MNNSPIAHNSLNNSILPPPHGGDCEVISHSESAAYTILPRKAHAFGGGIFCALLLVLMLGLSACSKSQPATSDPKQGGGSTPNQGVTFEIDTNWSGDTTIFIDPIAP